MIDSSRRRFLTQVGLGAGLLPWFAPRVARAGCLTMPPRRLLVIVRPNGLEEWVTGSGTACTFPATMRALEPHRDELSFVRVRLQNLKDTDNPQRVDQTGHAASPALFTGRRYAELGPNMSHVAGGPSVDQFVGRALSVRPDAPPRAALNLGCSHKGVFTFWKDARVPQAPNNDPYRVFDEIFLGGTGPDDGGKAARDRQKRRLVEQFVVDDLRAFRTRLGTENQRRVDAHLESVLAILKETAQGPAKLGDCDAPVLEPGVSVTDARQQPQIFDLHAKLAVKALAADVTRVVGITLGNSDNEHITATWLGATVDPDGGFDHLSTNEHAHAHQGLADKARMDTWYFEKLASVLTMLANEVEADGSTLLSNTAVLFANHQKTGGGHETDEVPWIVAGRCGGGLRPRGHLELGNPMQTAVLSELIAAMNVDPSGFFEGPYDATMPELRGP